MPPSEKKPHEIAVDEFEEADKTYKELEDYITSGDAAADIAAEHAVNREAARADWLELWSQLREKLDDRNTKYVNAANELRKAIVPDIAQGAKWRGPSGRADRLVYGKLECNTRTKRFFIGDEFLKLVERYGLLDEVTKLTYQDDKTGHREPVVRSEILVEFRPMLQWLEDRDNTKDPKDPSVYRIILNGAYEEKEETPMVQGAKRVAFLGQSVDK